jgi:hypothetical protein
MDGPNYVVRTTWAHDNISPSTLDPAGVSTAPSFSILARMTKDPLLYDLGVHEQPSCYDQGYGARVTFPLDNSAPILKIIKFQPAKRLPGIPRPASSEIDGALVLAQIVLEPIDLNLDESFAADSATYVDGDLLPYRGQWQDMRLRIRREDSEVIMDVYLNDRNLNQPILSFTDTIDPLWGGIGVPGFEFLSATLVDQPAGTSPFDVSGLSLLRCGIFSAETFLDVAKPVNITPGSMWTYGRVTDRVILLVEKNGDAKYNATTSTQTKFNTYLNFVLEAESEIIRQEGYYEWLKRSQRIYLSENQSDYELPADMGLLEQIRPGNWGAVPLVEVDRWRFQQFIGNSGDTNDRPAMFTIQDSGPDGRLVVRLYPFPGENQIPDRSEAPYIIVDYYGKQLFPNNPYEQLPFIPQQHFDVLTYGAAYHALLLDTDPDNRDAMKAAYERKLAGIVRANNRLSSSQHLVVRSVADIMQPEEIPLTRVTQLGSLLI